MCVLTSKRVLGVKLHAHARAYNLALSDQLPQLRVMKSEQPFEFHAGRLASDLPQAQVIEEG